MGFLELWKKQSQDYVFGYAVPENTPKPGSGVQLAANDDYVTVWLRRMHIVAVRIGTEKFYGAIHGDLGIWHSSGEFVNFKQVITPPELRDVPAKELDRTIIANQVLLGPTPYRGGRLQMNFALLSIKSGDLAGPYLEILGSLASSAGVTFVSVAQPFLQPLQKGLELLTGAEGKAVLEIQLVTNIDSPRTGVFVLIRAPNTKLKLEEIKVQQDYSLTKQGRPLSEYPYAVFSIETSQTRPDFNGIPEVRKAYDFVIQAVKSDKPQEYKEALIVFRRTVLLSPDLLDAHAETLYDQVKTKMDAIMGQPLTSADRSAKSIPNLSEFDPF